MQQSHYRLKMLYDISHRKDEPVVSGDQEREVYSKQQDFRIIPS